MFGHDRAELHQPGLTGDRLPVLTTPDELIAIPKPSTWDDLLRRALDVSLASAALAVLSVSMLLIAMCIRLTSRGPALFRQQRVGLNDRSFTF
ncbi:sugar transferase [Saccharopolyspora sp. NPDC002376]